MENPLDTPHPYECMENPVEAFNSKDPDQRNRAIADPGLPEELWLQLLPYTVIAWANPQLPLYILKNGVPSCLAAMWRSWGRKPLAPEARDLAVQGQKVLRYLMQQQWSAAASGRELLELVLRLVGGGPPNPLRFVMVRLHEAYAYCYRCPAGDASYKDPKLLASYAAFDNLVCAVLRPHLSRRFSEYQTEALHKANVLRKHLEPEGWDAEYPWIKTRSIWAVARLYLHETALTTDQQSFKDAHDGMTSRLSCLQPHCDPLPILLRMCPTPGALWTYQDQETPWKEWIDGPDHLQ